MHMSRSKINAKNSLHLIRRMFNAHITFRDGAVTHRVSPQLPNFEKPGLAATAKIMKLYEHFIKSKNLIVVWFSCDLDTG